MKFKKWFHFFSKIYKLRIQKGNPEEGGIEKKGWKDILYFWAKWLRLAILTFNPFIAHHGAPHQMTIGPDEVTCTPQSLSIGIENLNVPYWNIFEFITEKRGRCGPSKEECIQYYNKKLDLFYWNKIMEGDLNVKEI